ncbi:MAG: hypothetical protein PHH54_04640 [Candidatus Nanoarchaeia archaeon]|nr:hypothetical protein [Candidatus Nanoarchaeia archaeon]MDD5741244.1 hypothetical protein [Candidatus Nanoarchaeia archaeon]
MTKKNLESRSEPSIIVHVCGSQDVNNPAYQKLIRYCVKDIKKYNQERFKN